MEVLVCGSRLVFEQDLEDLIHSLTAVAGTLDLEEQQVNQRNAVKGEMPIINRHSWFQRSTTAEVVAENAPPSSIRRLQNYRCYLQQKQGFVESDPTSLFQSQSVILVHSKDDRFFENRDTALRLACDHHVRINIMAETLFYGSYSSQQWKRLLQLLPQYWKEATLSLGGHTISGLNSFNPSSAYNICFSDVTSRPWSTSGVGMELPPRLCDDSNWRGLVVCATFGQSYSGPTIWSSGVKLVCHLRSNDYCLNPIPTCCGTDKFFKQGSHPRLTWVTYIPRALLTEFNVVSHVEASIYINCPSLKVHTCSISLLYESQVDNFQKFIIDSWTSFFYKFPFIRQLVEADDYQNVHQRRPKKPMLEPKKISVFQTRKKRKRPMLEPHIKNFDRDLIYDATVPSNKIPEWFGELGKLYGGGRIDFQLPPSPSLCSDKDWIGLALCAKFDHELKDKDNYSFAWRLQTAKIAGNNDHRYVATSEECQSLKRHHPDGLVIWLSYIPRRWFLHQLNDESSLSVGFLAKDRLPNAAGHRFVYEHKVEEFEQLCIDLHQFHA